MIRFGCKTGSAKIWMIKFGREALSVRSLTLGVSFFC